VVQYESIRKLCAGKGLSERSIARLLRVSRNTVAKYRDGEVIPGQRELLVRASPVTGPIRGLILEILAEDQSRTVQADAHRQTHL
jgi:transcriptional regulator with XRE-family HTH domain